MSEIVRSYLGKVKVSKLLTKWSTEPEPLFWPRGKKEIDDFIFVVYGPGPFKKRSRIKWLRRRRKIVLAAKTMAALTSIPFHSRLVNLQPMDESSGKVFYADVRFQPNKI